VICDRFVWDALIDRQIYYPKSAWPEILIRRGYGLLGAKPDLSCLLSVPLEVSKQRSEVKDEPFPDAPEIRTARHALYRDLEADPTLRVLNATRPPDQIVDEILKALPAR
jgi:thymidylate kinase